MANKQLGVVVVNPLVGEPSFTVAGTGIDLVEGEVQPRPDDPLPYIVSRKGDSTDYKEMVFEILTPK